MHKSKLAGFIIDCQTDDLAAAADFWSQALGMEMQALPGDEGDKYVRLVDPNDALHIEVQSVSHPSRVHLDIEADDIEAEVRRLEALGRETRRSRCTRGGSWKRRPGSDSASSARARRASTSGPGAGLRALAP